MLAWISVNLCIKFTRKLSIISAHYQLILDQHPARMFIENPKSYLDLLYSVEYMCSAMTEHQVINFYMICIVVSNLLRLE